MQEIKITFTFFNFDELGIERSSGASWRVLISLDIIDETSSAATVTEKQSIIL